MKIKCEATGKVRFDDINAAKESMILLRLHWKKQWLGKRRKHRQGKPAQKRVYYCTECHGYHLTSWSKNYKKKEPPNDILKQLIINMTQDKGLRGKDLQPLAG